MTVQQNHHNRPHRTVFKFGEIARRLGFVGEDALADALRRQRERLDRGESHKLLGLILLELGHIDNQQLIEILRHFETTQKSGSGEHAAAV